MFHHRNRKLARFTLCYRLSSLLPRRFAEHPSFPLPMGLAEHSTLLLLRRRSVGPVPWNLYYRRRPITSSYMQNETFVSKCAKNDRLKLSLSKTLLSINFRNLRSPPPSLFYSCFLSLQFLQIALFLAFFSFVFGCLSCSGRFLSRF